MSKSLVPAVTAAAVALLALPAASAGATKTVAVGDDYFVRAGAPPTVRVAAGTRVKWVFRGDSSHNVTVTKGPARFRSRSQDSGSFARTVRKRGTYRIVCTIHAPEQRMKLVVR